jgi:GTP-binding protein
LINHFIVNGSWYLVDLPGYGYAKRSQTDRNRWQQMIEQYLRKRPNLINVFVLIDARHTPQKNDLEFINQLDKWQVPFTLIFTKADKEKPTVVMRNEKLFLDKMRETWQFLPQSFITSAEKKQGREEVLSLIQKLNEKAIQQSK